MKSFSQSISHNNSRRKIIKTLNDATNDDKRRNYRRLILPGEVYAWKIKKKELIILIHSTMSSEEWVEEEEGICSFEFMVWKEEKTMTIKYLIISSHSLANLIFSSSAFFFPFSPDFSEAAKRVSENCRRMVKKEEMWEINEIKIHL